MNVDIFTNNYLKGGKGGKHREGHKKGVQPLLKWCFVILSSSAGILCICRRQAKHEVCMWLHVRVIVRPMTCFDMTRADVIRICAVGRVLVRDGDVGAAGRQGTILGI